METAPPPVVRYHVSLYRAGGRYFARVRELPGCVALGTSEVDAIENVRATIRAWEWAARIVRGYPATVEVEITA